MKTSQKTKFVLVDRDGVINEVVRDGYVTDVEGVRLLPGAAVAIAELNGAGFGVIVVSNQQCVGKGLLSLDELEGISAAIRDGVATKSGGHIEDFFYCPHLASEECACRKPKPGLLIQARERFGFDLSETYFVGDSYRDVETAGNAGCRCVFVLSGLDAERYRTGEPPPNAPEHIAADLLGAARYILEGAVRGKVCRR